MRLDRLFLNEPAMTESTFTIMTLFIHVVANIRASTVQYTCISMVAAACLQLVFSPTRPLNYVHHRQCIARSRDELSAHPTSHSSPRHSSTHARALQRTCPTQIDHDIRGYQRDAVIDEALWVSLDVYHGVEI